MITILLISAFILMSLILFIQCRYIHDSKIKLENKIIETRTEMVKEFTTELDIFKNAVNYHSEHIGDKLGMFYRQIEQITTAVNDLYDEVNKNKNIEEKL